MKIRLSNRKSSRKAYPCSAMIARIRLEIDLHGRLCGSKQLDDVDCRIGVQKAPVDPALLMGEA